MPAQTIVTGSSIENRSAVSFRSDGGPAFQNELANACVWLA